MEWCQNARHSDKYFVKTTLYEALNRLKEEYVRLCSEAAEKVTASQLEREFNGVSHNCENTVKQAASNADRFGHSCN